MRRLLVPLLATAGLLLPVAPGQAAAPRVLYFANAGGCGEESPVNVLQAAPDPDGECANLQFGADPAPVTFLAEDVYRARSSVLGFLIDGRKRLTGTVYLANFALVGGTPVTSTGGPVAADVVVSLNGVTVARRGASGQTQPNGTLAVPINVALPKVLDGKRLTTAVVRVTYTQALGVTGVSYTPPAQSRLLVPRR